MGDFNGDGIPDIVTANDGLLASVQSGVPQQAGITYLAGNGDGSFQPGINIPAATTLIYSVAVGDFNGDGRSDLASGLTIFLGAAVNAPLGVTTAEPLSATAGDAALTLDVNGYGFVSGSRILWNGVPLATTALGPGTLTAPVVAGLIATREPRRSAYRPGWRGLVEFSFLHDQCSLSFRHFEHQYGGQFRRRVRLV